MNVLRSLATMLLLRTVGAVLSHLLVAAAMMALWIDPMFFGPEVASNVDPILMVEFVVLHSTAFLVAARFAKGFPGWVFIIVYTPIAIILGTQMSSFVVTAFVFWHLAAGVWGDFDMAERSIQGFLARYVPMFLWFVILPFVVVLFRLPGLGWEQYPRLAFRTEEGFSSAALTPAWATLYFAGRALWEIAVRHWERTGALSRFSTAVRKT